MRHHRVRQGSITEDELVHDARQSGGRSCKRDEVVAITWQRIMDDENRIIEVVFQPTRVGFSPV